MDREYLTIIIIPLMEATRLRPVSFFFYMYLYIKNGESAIVVKWYLYILELRNTQSGYHFPQIIVFLLWIILVVLLAISSLQ